MNKALVTGGAGFIGSNVSRLLLENGCEVAVFDDLSTGYLENLSELDVEFINGDVRDVNQLSRAMQGADVVFHLAASVGNLRSIEDPVSDAQVNVIGTINLLEAARRFEVRKIVYSSSAAIFGELKRLPIGEDHPAEPDSPYGVSKLAAEKNCLAYSRLYDVEIVCLRYFNVYGINQRYDVYGNVIPIFASRLLRGEPLTIYDDGEQTRDFVNALDVARANLLAAKADGVSGAFNIASGHSISINYLANIMQEVSGRQVGIEYAPPRKGEVRHSQADISSASRLLGYAPETDLAQGLQAYVGWLKGIG